MLHISSKIAHLEALQGDLKKAELGFQWVLEKINEQVSRLTEEAATDLHELAGITKDWYVHSQIANRNNICFFNVHAVTLNC